MLFVSLGLGSVIASAVTAAPWLIAVGRHKPAIFTGAGMLLAVNYWLAIVRPRGCAPGEICHVDSPAMRANRALYWASVAIYGGAAALTLGSTWWLGRQS